jgi:protein-disulfide isomerase
MEQPAHRPQSSSIWQGTSPQLSFIFGLIAGVAATAIIGWILVMPKTTSSKGSTTTNTNPTATAPTFSDVKAVTDSDYVRGDKNAKITLIEYSDYECPYCKTFHPTIRDQVMKDYEGQIRWVYRHFPLSFHQNAPKQSEAALCVGKLVGNDAFWEFSDKLFERTASNGTGFALTDLPALAKEVGANEAQFTTCLDSGEMAARVAAEMADGQGGGATGTPTTFIVGPDGKTIDAIPGAESYATIKRRLDAALASI